MAARSATTVFQNNAIDYDGIRIYSGTVTEFEALIIPEPAPATLFSLAAASFLMLRRRPTHQA